jgi:hypothetical protein
MYGKRRGARGPRRLERFLLLIDLFHLRPQWLVV